ncbi:MAG TPA: DUF6159 family protein [Verrucomicrobiae bacterium]|jgi:hypothetical protein
MNKIKRSGKLLKAAFAVLFREKKLLFFPLVATGLAAVMALFFITPILLYPTGHSYFSAAHWSALAGRLAQSFEASNHAPNQPVLPSKTGLMMLLSEHWWLTPFFAVAYFTSMFLATFSNVAFYHEIMQALNGQTVSIRRGFRFACERWRAVLLWSLFAGLVGYLIQTLQERLGIFGRLVTGLIGFVWSVACIFIIPTLVRDTETSNPLKLLCNSAGTLKRTWGELIIGFAGLELAFGLIFMLYLLMVAVVAGVGGACFGLYFALWTALAGFVGMLLLAMPLSWISGVVNPVFRCALFIYATEGVVPESFDKELLDSAWKVK